MPCNQNCWTYWKYPKKLAGKNVAANLNRIPGVRRAQVLGFEISDNSRYRGTLPRLQQRVGVL